MNAGTIRDICTSQVIGGRPASSGLRDGNSSRFPAPGWGPLLDLKTSAFRAVLAIVMETAIAFELAMPFPECIAQARVPELQARRQLVNRGGESRLAAFEHLDLHPAIIEHLHGRSFRGERRFAAD